MKVQPFVFRSLNVPMPMMPKSEGGIEVTLPEPAPTAAPEPVVRMYTEEEMAAAKEEAYREGRIAGEAAAQAAADHQARQTEEAIQSVLAQIDTRLANMLAEYDAYYKTRQQDIAGLVMIAARKVAGAALREMPLAPIEAMVRDCFAMIAGAPALMIHVHPTLSEQLEHRLGTQARDAHFGGSWSVLPDPHQGISDVRVEWKNGFAERHAEGLWVHLDHLVQQVVTGLFAPAKDKIAEQGDEMLTKPEQSESNS